MSSPARAKTTDRQAVSKKLVSILKKKYKSSPPKIERPVLETLLYAICLENATHEDAEAALKRLMETFHDLNEVRVSSISELVVPFETMEDPEWRAARVRAVLQYVFEKHFEYAFETLRRKTLELATKQLGRIKELSPFVRNFTLQTALSSHLVPLDQRMTDTAIWLGFIPQGESPEQAAETLKSVIRKPDTPLFCHLLRCVAVDSKMQKAFDLEKFPPPEEGFDLATAPERLEQLLKHGAAALKPRRVKKAKAGVAKNKPKTARPRSSRDGAVRGSSKSGAAKKPTRRPASVRKKK